MMKDLKFKIHYEVIYMTDRKHNWAFLVYTLYFAYKMRWITAMVELLNVTSILNNKVHFVYINNIKIGTGPRVIMLYIGNFSFL